MRHDPVRTNFLENTGAYSWQAAAWLSEDELTTRGPAELERPVPPTLHDAAAVWPSQVSALSTVWWADTTRVTAVTRTPLLSRRGSAVARAVSTITQSFVEMPVGLAELLGAPTPVQELPRLTDYGHATDVVDAVIALVRHGLLEMSQRVEVTLREVRQEPFVELTPGTAGEVLVTNLLNGRFLRVDAATADLIDSLRRPAPMSGPLTRPLLALVEAGVFRLTGEP